jgi:hypothetical protein
MTRKSPTNSDVELRIHVQGAPEDSTGRLQTIGVVGRHGYRTELGAPTVFADALTERDGQLRVWTSEWHEERALPALRAMLELPFERVIIPHGEPVHDREEFERALERPTWPCSPLHYAAILGSIGLVRRLVERDADVKDRDELTHRTPLEWARSGNQDAVAAYLESVQ